MTSAIPQTTTPMTPNPPEMRRASRSGVAQGIYHQATMANGSHNSRPRLASPSHVSNFSESAFMSSYTTTHTSGSSPPFSNLNHSRSYSSFQQSPSSSSGYPTPQRQGWREWAGDKISKAKARGVGLGLSASGYIGASRSGEPPTESSAGAPSVSSSNSDLTEVITLFPGWAARRYANQLHRRSESDLTAPEPFEVEVFAAGYAISYRNRDNMSRSHRAFIRLAKGFASLPKLVAESTTQSRPTTQTPQSTEDQAGASHLPPRPDEMDEAYEVAYRQENKELSRSASTPNLPPRSILNPAEITLKTQVDPSPGESFINLTADAIHRLHTNLEERLKPFWSSVVSNRTVRLHLFASPRQSDSNMDHLDEQSYWEYNKPLATTQVVTATDGSFQAKFVVGWDELCQHPRALHIAFGLGDEGGLKDLEHNVVVVAELVEPMLDQQPNVPYASYTSPRRAAMHPPTPPVTAKTQIHIPITHSPIRVISDIDDTVKQSGILGGARSVFYNVFVKELGECVVPGMGKWYSDMWNRGVRFHYVSNGPFEYIAVLNEYFALSELPPGSVKLKSYARRSLFNGLLTSAAGRKRAGVEEILNAFPDSRFFLIGDSGEQDLELYADLARQRPSNILGIFIRDVSTIEGVTDPIDDPTGWSAVVAHATSRTLGVDSQTNLEGQQLKGYPERRRPSLDPEFISNTPLSAAKRSVTGLISSVSRKSNSLSSMLTFSEREREEANAVLGADAGYFRSQTSPRSRHAGGGSIPFSEPEEFGEEEGYAPPVPPKGADTDPTPRIRSTPTMPANATSSTIKPSSSNGKNHEYVTEPPRPIPPPNPFSRPSSSRSSTAASSIRQGSIATNSPGQMLADVATRRSQRSGDTASSVSSTSSSSSSRSRFSFAFSGSNSGKSETDLSSETPMQSTFRAKVERVTRNMANASSVEDRRRAEVQLRVWRARTVVPSHVMLRLFRHPEECVEARELLDRELRSS